MDEALLERAKQLGITLVPPSEREQEPDDEEQISAAE